MPPLHPVLVHFPIGILVLSILFECFGVITKRAEVSRFGWWAQLGGSLGLLIAVLTGLLAKRSTSIGSPAQSIFENHEQFAFLTSAIFAVLLLWRIAGKGKLPDYAPRAYLCLFAIGVATLLVTAWFGGELVFRFGTGVRVP
jgi:uncharacterized membrane protein